MVPGQGEEVPDIGSERSQDEGEDREEAYKKLMEEFVEDDRLSNKHVKYTDLATRAKEDMDFPDEIDTPIGYKARTRFTKYRGVRSLQHSEWDAFENLPHEYNKIFRFNKFNNSKKVSFEMAQNDGLPIRGNYIRMYLTPLNEKAVEGMGQL